MDVPGSQYSNKAFRIVYLTIDYILWFYIYNLAVLMYGVICPRCYKWNCRVTCFQIKKSVLDVFGLYFLRAFIRIIVSFLQKRSPALFHFYLNYH